MTGRTTRASATPSRAQRDSHAPSTTRTSRIRQTPRNSAAVDLVSNATPGSGTASSGIELPEYVPLEHPLSNSALNRLAALTAPHHDKEKDLSDKRLKEAAEIAIKALTDSAGDINECLLQREEAVTSGRNAVEKRKRGQSEQNENSSSQEGGQLANEDELRAATEKQAEDEAQLAELREKTLKMTQRMEISLRKAIDLKAALADFAEGVSKVNGAARSAASAGGQQPQTQRTRSGTQPTQDDSTPNPTVGTNAGPSTGQTDTSPTEQPNLAAIFDQHITQAATKYDSLTLPERYAQDNDYANFKRMVHYASHNTDDAPPVPHSRTWFLPSGPAPAAGVTLPSNNTNEDDNDEEDEDINIVRERISTKCPITMAPFVNPVTSLKCPHSFERSAILEMISAARPPTRQPGMPAPVKTVECPVSGCQQQLSQSDISVDAVTVRRIRRVQEAEKREREAAARRRSAAGDGMVIDDDEEATQVGEEEEIDDIDEVDEEPVERIKRERESRRRQIDGDEEMDDV